MNSEKNNFVEEIHRNHFSIRYKIKEKLFEGQSDFQKVEVVETLGYGRMLLNDSLVMVTEKDEFIYHDMISHVPLFVHPNPKKVLIVGGGDGGTAREVLRHSSVESVVMVEIDKMVVDACREFIPQTSKELANPKLTLLIEDGVKYMKESSDTFDVIIIDSTDPIGPATPLFGEEFYKNVYARLSDNGIVVAQGESPFYEEVMQKKLLIIVSNIFPLRTYYNFNNMTYPGGLWSFLFASKGRHPIKDFQANRIEQSGLDFNYYNSEIHKGCFSLPQFMVNNLKELIQI
ncbi:MAG: polyamine aminopropyltransferase [Bdellovibrionales bacterium]|nr:polyamine aminopropyltransferase [Bdellovibrionales bacterium]